jgi:hypothetical protein
MRPSITMSEVTDLGETLEFSHNSWIRQVTYNKSTKQMLITTEKSSYECQGVPLEIFEEFASAPSKGSYFNRNIKGKFNHEYF